MIEFIRAGGLFALFTMFLPALALSEPLALGAPVTALSAASSTGGEKALWAIANGELIEADVKTGRLAKFVPAGLSEGGAINALTQGADGRLYVAGPGSGVWRYSTENQQWADLSETLPTLNVTAIAAHSTQAETLYVYVPEVGILRSRDGGSEWVQVDGGPQEAIRTFLHSNMPGSMESGWLFAGTPRGVARSMDCFCLWSDAGELRGEVSSLAYNFDSPMNVYAVIDGRLNHSADGGESWSAMAVPKDVSAVAYDSETGRLFAGTTDGNLLYREASGEWQGIRRD
ncbi:WD40/YVTN/BNR-like repeat-containing protein [Marinobacter fonticola]|uniref:WD40/YVTN/BNR-like repeat-containing protein n=1 Tax=Marinobacter fonticola TaxID=2603215 RepID=UPI0011E7428B|nr:hypothetical protein [Marinobacter fonticola]